MWKDGNKVKRAVDDVENELKAEKIKLILKKGQCDDIFRDLSLHGQESGVMQDDAGDAGRVTLITKMKFKRKNVEIMAQRLQLLQDLKLVRGRVMLRVILKRI